MKVYLDNSIFFLQERGGISSYWNQILRLSTNGSITISTNMRLLLVLSKVVERLEPIRPLLRQLLKMFPIIVTNRIDIIHSSYYRTPWLFYRGSYVITIHDMIPEMFYTGVSRKLAVYYKRRAIRRASKIVCVSETTRADLLRLYPEIEGAKAITILHGSRLSEVSKEKRNLNQIVYLGGRKERYKNFNEMIRSLAGCNFHLIIIGSALSITERVELQKLLPGRFSSLVFPTDEIVDDVLRSSLALLYPSAYEGFGLPVLEAMSFGTPVVCSDTKVFKELFSTAAVFTDFDKSDNLCKSLNLVKNTFNKLSRASLDLNEQFSWRKTRQEHLALYKTI